MRFKKWIEAVDVLAQKASNTFVKQKWNTDSILNALGLSPVKLKTINTGSFATVYQHPTDPSKVIKVTSDKADGRRLVKAQQLHSPNVVRIHQSTQLPNGSWVLIADFVAGPSMPYTSNTLAALINGKTMMDDPAAAARKIVQIGASPFREQILAKMGRDNNIERQKLAELFITLSRLEKLGIDMFDFTDNIIDVGKYYVIIDMGL